MIIKKNKPVDKDMIGTTRWVKKFAFYPTGIGLDVHWLKFYYQQQEYVLSHQYSKVFKNYIEVAYWRDIEWMKKLNKPKDIE